jgi:hypothetical protein
MDIFFKVSTENLSSMGYLTIYTRSNRVVIIRSVITRIFLMLCNAGTVTFQPFSTKTLVINYNVLVPVNHIVIDYCCSLFIVIIHLFCSLFDLHSFSVRLLFHYSLFKRKGSFLILDHISGISILLYLLYKNTITNYAS